MLSKGWINGEQKRRCYTAKRRPLPCTTMYVRSGMWSLHSHSKMILFRPPWIKDLFFDSTSLSAHYHYKGGSGKKIDRSLPICVSRVWCVSFDNICIALTWGLDERRAILLTNLSPRSESAFPPLSTIFVYCSNRSTNRCFFSLCIGFRVHSYALLLPMFLFNGPRVSQSLFLTHSWLKTRVLAQFRPHCHSNEATCLWNRGRVTMTFTSRNVFGSHRGWKCCAHKFWTIFWRWRFSM